MTASASTLFVTVSGWAIDLAAPRAEDVDFDDIAEQLSKVARYNGATPGSIYFVAQHVSLGADWILAQSSGEHDHIGHEDPPFRWKASEEAQIAAAYFVLHDGEESYLGDDTTPKKRTIDQECQRFGVAAGVLREALARIVERHSAAIHAAAGLAWPPPPEIAALVHEIDLRMLVSEWRALRPRHPLPAHYAAYAPLPIAIEPWPWDFAHEQLSRRMALLLPALRAKAGAVDGEIGTSSR